MQRNENPLALLVGMQTGGIAPENCVEVPQKIKNKKKKSYNPAIALLGIYPKDTGVLIQRGTCTDCL